MSEHTNIVYCPNCGVQNDARLNYCRSCGAPLYETAQMKQQTDGLCLAGMIIGIVSIITFYLLIPSIIGLVLSIKGYKKYNGGKNKGFALVGIITSAVSLALFAVLFEVIWFMVGVIVTGVC